MAEFDNIQKIAPFLDKHLLLNLLDHVQSQKVSGRSRCTATCCVVQYGAARTAQVSQAAATEEGPTGVSGCSP
jgi:hypothetical protein